MNITLLKLALASAWNRRFTLGLTLLALASLATAFVTTPEQLIAVRAAMGIAAAMTTPGSMSLAFRLFDDDTLRVRAITLISTVGLVGLAADRAGGGHLVEVAQRGGRVRKKRPGMAARTAQPQQRLKVRDRGGRSGSRGSH